MLCLGYNNLSAENTIYLKSEVRVRISLYSSTVLNPGKCNVKDSRLDDVDGITKAKKRTYVQVEIVGEDAALDSDVILVPKENRTDLILADLEFVETRLGRGPQAEEKAVLEKMKAALEKEGFISSVGLTDDEKKLIAGYGLLTLKPVILFEAADLDDRDGLLRRALDEGGYTSFFTTGEKETRAWLIKKGTTAWEASGAIHSDIQHGFIRAEIISLDDFLSCGGESRAKQAGKQRLEQKTYVMQPADITTFRFNK